MQAGPILRGRASRRHQPRLPPARSLVLQQDQEDPPVTDPAAQVMLSVPDAGHHGAARVDAVTALAEALGCQVRSRDLLTGHRTRRPGGDYYIDVHGPAAAVRWFARALPLIIGRLDAAAALATRGYAAWLRDGCRDDDHMPAERPALRASWRRRYLRAYASALAGRMTGTCPPAGGCAAPGELYRGHQAFRAAARDAGRARLGDYLPAAPRHA